MCNLRHVFCTYWCDIYWNFIQLFHFLNIFTFYKDKRLRWTLISYFFINQIVDAVLFFCFLWSVWVIQFFFKSWSIRWQYCSPSAACNELGECCMGMLDRPAQLVPIFFFTSPFVFKGAGNASETQEETSLPALMFFKNPRSFNDFTVPQVTVSQ